MESIKAFIANPITWEKYVTASVASIAVYCTALGIWWLINKARERKDLRACVMSWTWTDMK